MSFRDHQNALAVGISPAGDPADTAEAQALLGQPALLSPTLTAALDAVSSAAKATNPVRAPAMDGDGYQLVLLHLWSARQALDRLCGDLPFGVRLELADHARTSVVAALAVLDRLPDRQLGPILVLPASLSAAQVQALDAVARRLVPCVPPAGELRHRMDKPSHLDLAAGHLTYAAAAFERPRSAAPSNYLWSEDGQ